MPQIEPHVDLSTIDFTRCVADREAIRKYLPHRFDMEMLTAVLHIDSEKQLIFGYRDIGNDEFWTRGHFPKHPIFPGVLMVEAAAQLSAFYSIYVKISAGRLMGLGGIENTRFRRGVRPGERLVLVGKGARVKQRMTEFNVQGFVDGELAFHTDVIGVSLGMLEDV